MSSFRPPGGGSPDPPAAGRAKGRSARALPHAQLVRAQCQPARAGTSLPHAMTPAAAVTATATVAVTATVTAAATATAAAAGTVPAQ
ncbi:MAG: hypothetical protein HYZ29_28285 [Myxococcales bacterium]|nr:hypothetical protein [Myxococcales bacterium]